MMIKTFIKSKCRATLITRPRKWGKTVNLDMIQRFFEVEINDIGIQKRIMDRRNHKLFQGGKIQLQDQSAKILTPVKDLKPLKIANDSKTTKYLGMKPVLRFNMSDIKGRNYQAVENRLKMEMKNLFALHGYLKVYFSNESIMLNASDKARLARYYLNKPLDLKDLEEGLYYLSRMLFEHYRRKIIVLIEEYDTPINHAAENFGTRDKEKLKLLDLLRNMFKQVPENWYMKRTLITGTLPVTETGLFTNSSVCAWSVLDEEYSDFFGFSDFEVDEVLKSMEMPTDKESTGKMRYWFSGFLHGGRTLYNPLDIMGYASNKGRISDYWVDSGRMKSLEDFMLSDKSQDDLSKLLEDEGITRSICKFYIDNENKFNDPNGTLYSLFLHYGYLNAFRINETANQYSLKIPNQEMRNFFVDFKTHWFCNKYDVMVNDLYEFVGSLITSQVNQLKENLDRVFDSFKNTTLQREIDYHRIMGEILSRLLNHNFIFSNKHFNLSTLFHLIVPRSEYQGHVAIVLEYLVLGEPDPKRTISRQLQGLAQYVLEKIDSNVYGPLIIKYKYVDKVITVAVAFYKAELEIAYKMFKQE